MRGDRPTLANGAILLVAALLLALPATRPEAAGNARASRREAALVPRLVLGSPGTGEREVAAPDLRFVFFKRTYYARRAPRSESPGGRRVDVEDRRATCRCLRFQDWTKVKFSDLRQLEITYPQGGGQAMVRFTKRPGPMNEVSAGAFFGADSSLAPRFTATIDGAVREFPLIVGDSPDERWPEENLLRVLFLPPPRPPRPARHR